MGCLPIEYVIRNSFNNRSNYKSNNRRLSNSNNKRFYSKDNRDSRSNSKRSYKFSSCYNRRNFSSKKVKRGF